MKKSTNNYTEADKIELVQTMLLNGWNHLETGKQLDINANTVAFWFCQYYQRANDELKTEDKVDDFDHLDPLNFYKAHLEGKVVQFWCDSKWNDFGAKGVKPITKISYEMIASEIEEGRIRLKPQQVIDLEEQLKQSLSVK